MNRSVGFVLSGCAIALMLVTMAPQARALLEGWIHPAVRVRIKERLAANIPPGPRYVLEVDMSPFERKFPKLQEARSIGKGVTVAYQSR